MCRFIGLFTLRMKSINTSDLQKSTLSFGKQRTAIDHTISLRPGGKQHLHQRPVVYPIELIVRLMDQHCVRNSTQCSVNSKDTLLMRQLPLSHRITTTTTTKKTVLYRLDKCKDCSRYFFFYLPPLSCALRNSYSSNVRYSTSPPHWLKLVQICWILHDRWSFW